MAIVTTILAGFPRNNPAPRVRFPAGTANPGRKTCSKNAFSIAGIAPSHSGYTTTKWSAQAIVS